MEEYLVHQGYSPRQVQEQVEYLNRKKGTVTEKKAWVMPKELHRRLWGDFYGNEEKFYLDAQKFVLNFSKKSLNECLGDLGKKLEQDVLS